MFTMIYSVRNTLRLCRIKCVLQEKRFNHVRVTNTIGKSDENCDKKDFKTLLQKYKDKVSFSTYIEHEKIELGYFKYHLKTLKKVKVDVAKQFEEKTLPPLPVALQYVVEKERLLNSDTSINDQETPNKNEIFQLPFAKTTQIETKNDDNKRGQDTAICSEDRTDYDKSNLDRWMSSYEYYDDTQLDDNDDQWVKHYGTPDPSVGITQVQCGGCGALLHCSEPSIPGYLPSEILRGRTLEELKTIECQRCHFLKEYNIALDVTVLPEEYENLLQSLRYIKALVIVMIDLLDFPCSIWPGIVNIIGTERPIIVVGNKVDLLPGDSIGYLKRVKECLVNEIKKSQLGEANIKHVSLISAKTGYGVEDLISVMFKEWLYKGDVFLVGCTNVGKSSLFNALLQSDYCKVQAVDIVQRATVSRWPGTTLHLLKFPINRPSGWKIYQRTRRLKSEAKLMKLEKQMRRAQLDGREPAQSPLLIGHIGRSFSYLTPEHSTGLAQKNQKMFLDEKDKLFAQSKWFYDTPGVIHPDQVLSLLSTEELLLTIPKKQIRPQTYYLDKGFTMFIGGLARLDHLDSQFPCRFTVFCSETLPITIVKTEDADEVYEKFVGTELFAVPSGGVKRLNSWPGLAQSKEVLEFTGEGPKMCCGDVVLSSVAWVGVTAKGATTCRVAAWTPDARGVHRRYPSLLPYAVNLKGKRIRETPAYMIGKPFSEQ